MSTPAWVMSGSTPPGTWDAVSDAFWSGQGVILNQQLAHLERLGPGDHITLATAEGTRTFPILAIFVDFRFAFLLFVLEMGFALMVVPPLRRRASLRVLEQTPSWHLSPE